MKEAIIPIITVLALISSGCVSYGSTSVQGKYVRTDDPQFYLIIGEDGIFNEQYVAVSGHRKAVLTTSGTYKIIDAFHIRLIYPPFGEFRELQVNGSHITFDKGGRTYEKVD